MYSKYFVPSNFGEMLASVQGRSVAQNAVGMEYILARVELDLIADDCVLLHHRPELG